MNLMVDDVKEYQQGSKNYNIPTTVKQNESNKREAMVEKGNIKRLTFAILLKRDAGR